MRLQGVEDAPTSPTPHPRCKHERTLSGGGILGWAGDVSSLIQGGLLMMVNIGDLLRRRAHLAPNTEALVEPATGRRLTYRELNARANCVANSLRGIGVSEGDRVALLLMNGAEFVETFYAGAKIGAVNVPLNWRLVAGRAGVHPRRRRRDGARVRGRVRRSGRRARVAREGDGDRALDPGRW